jgi:hypothetical protein
MVKQILQKILEEIQLRFKDLHVKIGAIVVGIILISFLFYVFKGHKTVYRTLFFPKVSYNQVVTDPTLLNEKRSLPELDTNEHNIRQLVEELILGPINPELTDFTSKETRLISLFLKGDLLYMDLSSDLIEQTNNKTLFTLKYKLDILKQNISFNFREVKDIHIFINGQTPKT